MTLPGSLETRWRTPALAQALAATWLRARGDAPPAIDVVALASVDSTNTRLLEAARRDTEPRLRLMVALEQTAGRGRRGRAWHASPDASLAFSLAVPVAATASLSLAVGAAVADALEPRTAASATSSGTPPRIALKWPNDLWLRDADAPMGGRKLGGILLEAAAGVVVAGIGLNVKTVTLAEAPVYGVASLDELDPTLDAAEALHRVAPAALHALLESHGSTTCRTTCKTTTWQTAWSDRDILMGRQVTATAADGRTIIGAARGIRDDGALRLQTDGVGEILAISSGEVSVRPHASNTATVSASSEL